MSDHDLHRIKITSDGFAQGTKVELDGKPMTGAVSLRIDANGDGRMKVFLELLCDEIEVEGQAFVAIEPAP